MKRRCNFFVALALLAAVSLACPAGLAAATDSLSQAAYVWQREWNEPVRTSVAQHAGAFERVIVLAAEVAWHGGEPGVIQVPVDYPVLKAAREPVGLALRIGPYPGPFVSNDSAANLVTGLAAALVAEAKTAGLAPRELQIDFDCAAAKLDGYQVWVEAIRRKIAPVPLIITALPAWLDQPDFGRLVVATDGYVLQVHSLAAPKNANASFTLCDPAAARRAVARAGEFGVPFRVALPTYGYVLAFDHAGKFLGLSAEGPGRNWPVDAQVREVRTDPLAMAQLVRTWSASHPAAMRGLIWYRLPVADDALNLRWPTVAAIMAGRSPTNHCRVQVSRREPALVEISLVNDGELDLAPPPAVTVHWQDARLVAGDGTGGFELADDEPTAARFQPTRPKVRLPAGESQTIGWLRLSQDREVHVETDKN